MFDHPFFNQRNATIMACGWLPLVHPDVYMAGQACRADKSPGLLQSNHHREA